MHKNIIIKILIGCAAALLIVLFMIFDVSQFLTLDFVKSYQADIEHLYSQDRIAVIGAYMMLYILITALSLPGAVVMTLAGGALFGLFVGTIVISFASTIGATIACFAARFLLRDWVQDRFGENLKAVNNGIKRDGALYLFTMRLIPVLPFFVVNLVMGLTKMRLLTFYLVSQIGMLAGTIVYVNAGKELAKITSLSGILSPGLIISFALLGLFPLLAKKLVSVYSNKKNHRIQTGNISTV